MLCSKLFIGLDNFDRFTDYVPIFSIHHMPYSCFICNIEASNGLGLHTLVHFDF